MVLAVAYLTSISSSVGMSDSKSGAVPPARPGDPFQERLQVGLPKQPVAVDWVPVRRDLPCAVPVAEGRLGNAKKARRVSYEQVAAQIGDPPGIAVRA